MRPDREAGRPLRFFARTLICVAPEICRTWYDRRRQDPNLARTLAENAPAESRPRAWKGQSRLGWGSAAWGENREGPISREGASPATIHRPRESQRLGLPAPAKAGRVERDRGESPLINYLLSTVHVKLPLQGQLPQIRGSEGKRRSPEVWASASGAEACRGGSSARLHEQTKRF